MNVNTQGALDVPDSRPPSKGERQRQAILDALVLLLDTHSIADLTVGQIAAEAGVGRSGFYFYFDSKFAALGELYQRLRADMLTRIGYYKRPEGVPAAEYVESFLREVHDVWVQGSAVLVATVQARDLDESTGATWRRDCAEMAEEIAREVEADTEARPSFPDVRSLVGYLTDMSTYLFYTDRVARADAARSESMLMSLKGIWLAAVWGIVDPAH